VFAVELKDLAPQITDHDIKGDKKKSRGKKKKKVMSNSSTVMKTNSQLLEILL